MTISGPQILSGTAFFAGGSKQRTLLYIPEKAITLALYGVRELHE